VKKKGIIGVVLVVFLLLALASPVLAAEPAITTVAPDSGVQGNTYPAIVITGTDFTGASAVSFGADIIVNGYVVDTPTQITATITIDAAAGAEVRDVSVTTSEGTGTKTSGFTVELATITVTAPTGFSLGYMTAGDTTTGTTTAGSVETNAQNWQVTALDEKGGDNAGKMVSGATPLTAKFQISKTAGASGLENADDPGLVYTQTDGTLPFHISQVVAGDAAPGAYTITITFTGSAL